MDDKMLQAKKEVLKELLMEAMAEMKSRNKKGLDDHRSSMQKVSVMAPDKEGLMQGLEKAEDTLEMLPEGEMMPEDSMEDDEDDEDEELF